MFIIRQVSGDLGYEIGRLFGKSPGIELVQRFWRHLFSLSELEYFIFFNTLRPEVSSSFPFGFCETIVLILLSFLMF